MEIVSHESTVPSGAPHTLQHEFADRAETFRNSLWRYAGGETTFDAVVSSFSALHATQRAIRRARQLQREGSVRL